MFIPAFLIMHRCLSLHRNTSFFQSTEPFIIAIIVSRWKTGSTEIMMKIARVSEMQQLDKTAVEQYGISESILMENAGSAVFSILQTQFGIPNKRFTLLCGPGNNGGDGFVIARKIHSNGGIPKVVLFGDRGRYRGSALMNLKILEKSRIAVTDFISPDDLRSDPAHCDVVVDALLGTGIIRPAEGSFREAIEWMNFSGKPVVSVDIPSGVCGNTGKVLGAAVNAAITVTLGLPKLGNLFYPGFKQCGKLIVSHISFPPAMFDHLKISISAGLDLYSRNPDFHKGDFGELLCIAGAFGYFGAPYFSAMAFLKAGGGYSRLAAPRSMIPFIAQKAGEVVFIPQEETASGSIAVSNKAELLALSDHMDVVVLGPGLSLNKETQVLARELALGIEKPLLLDGDGITALCEDPEILKLRRGGTIITPHMGEMARLTGQSIAYIKDHKIEVLQNAARNLNAVIVLKGAHTLIGCPDQRVFINLSGNSGMATAGSGDVLTGTIAAMVSGGYGLEEGAVKGVFLHGLSGDLAAEEKGEDGMTAQDILDYLPRAIKTIRNGLPGCMPERYAFPVIL